jgi:hypothetical protein
MDESVLVEAVLPTEVPPKSPPLLSTIRTSEIPASFEAGAGHESGEAAADERKRDVVGLGFALDDGQVWIVDAVREAVGEPNVLIDAVGAQPACRAPRDTSGAALPRRLRASFSSGG